MTDAATDPVRQSVAWVYRGVWGILARWFRVPAGPPTLPVIGGTAPVSMRPANGFLGYQRVLFGASVLGPIAGTIAGVAAINLALPMTGILISVPILIVLAVFLITGWTAVHLRFDTQWYVLTDRSVRIRRGIWVIQESTITFENVQDITIRQGPLQRYFGISDLLLETAGGGSSAPGKGQRTTPHAGSIQGIISATDLKDLISARVRASRSAGLGDDHPQTDLQALAQHAEVLRQIVAELRGASARR